MNGRAWEYADLSAIAELERECFSDPWSFQMLADTFFGENTLTAAAEEDGAEQQAQYADQTVPEGAHNDRCDHAQAGKNTKNSLKGSHLFSPGEV